MKESLKVKVCERCGKKTAEQVIEYNNLLVAMRKGWYCPLCFHWDIATGREHRVSHT
tara:strand:- start:2229 stop:2399 length:171 start_codon:yes stop_codon:yes gene_type:complete